MAVTITDIARCVGTEGQKSRKGKYIGSPPCHSPAMVTLGKVWGLRFSQL
jgi:hypothetical protein